MTHMKLQSAVVAGLGVYQFVLPKFLHGCVSQERTYNWCKSRPSE